MEILVGRKGTQRTPITDTTVSREHCKLTSNADGTYTLENISANGTFVNDTSIIRTMVTPDTIVRLGATFTISVRDLLPLQVAAPKPQQQPRQQTQQPQQPTIDPNQERYEREFRKLKAVYKRYKEDEAAIQKEINMTNFLRTLPMILMSMISLGTACIPDIGNLPRVIIGIIGLGLSVFSVVKLYNGSVNNPDKFNALKDQLMIDYVCPKCGHFLGFVPFENLENRSKCDYCKCKWK